MGVSLRHANPVRSALIADDDEFFRMAMMAVLKELGFGVVIETDSFEAALESLAATGELELGVFDLRMPGIEGAAALRCRASCGAVFQCGTSMRRNRPVCLTEGRMRYSHDRSFSPRGAVKGEPESCSA